MARTITEVKKEITDSILASETLQQRFGFDPLETWESQVSKTSIINLICAIVSTVIWTIENLFDLHKKEVDDTIVELKPHSLRWYRNKALIFQYGHALIPESDKYDNTGLTDEQIEQSIIIKQSAVDEIDGRLYLKVAKEENGALAPLSPDEFTPFAAYIQTIKDAGVRINIISEQPDYLRLVIDLYYDPLVLDGSGARIDGTDNTPVQDTIGQYLKSLPFNGEFVTAFLVDQLQSTEGVVIPEVISVQARYGVYDWQAIQARYKPDAGYLRIYEETDLTINFIANNV